jgi:DNA-binding HxlR family transcriptional regulator
MLDKVANTKHKDETPVEHGSLKVCPVFITLGLIANKWSVRILFSLLQAEGKTMRFSQLQKTLGGITQRELTKHLREFEKAGIVLRTVYPQIPPRVEYTVTALGDSLCKPIEELSRWADENGARVQKNREAFEERSAAKALAQ